MQTAPPAPQDARLDGLLRDYRPLAIVPDELMDAGGHVRPHWRPLLAALESFDVSELQRRFGFADRHLRDSGVVHRVYDTEGGAERPLPLSHVPLIVAPEEWQEIAEAVRQRATLLNLVLADLYGPQRLVAEGYLPGAAVAGSPEFLRPMVGIAPRGGEHLRFYAVDIGRGPDGRWWVMGDRTQAPSGAGYLLENRIALARALPELYRKLNVRRVAEFFRAFRQELYELSDSPARRVGLLTPGAYNESYFEHAYLARYLGFLLLQGEDLVVTDGRLYVRTVTGPQEIDVLLRRLDSAFADPLELNSASQIGVPGLVQAVRSGSVAIINALGSGVLEAPGLMSFLPGIATRLLGEPLRLPQVATWWCGDETVRDHAMADFDSRVAASSFAPFVPAPLRSAYEPVADMDPDRREAVRQAIAARGVDFVLQEAVKLSTTPVWTGDGLVPRPFVLRVFAARTENGWEVMPCGFCRISEALDVRAVTLQKHATVADVWVPSATPVEDISLLTPQPAAESRRQGDLLPAITAENLFWLGRYVERAEGTARVVRALASRMIDYDASEDGVIVEVGDLLLNLHAQARPAPPSSGEYGTAAPAPAIDGAFAVRALTDRSAPGSVASLAANALRAGAQIRERLSPDAWRILSDLAETAGWAPASPAGEAEAVSRSNQLLRLMAAFSGLAHNNMMRSAGWRFLQLGSRIERGLGAARTVRHLGAVERTPGAFEALLGVLDSQITFGTRFANVPGRSQVVDLVVLDPLNPRSLAFQTGPIEEHVQFLAALRDQTTPMKSEKIAISLGASLRTADAAETDDAFLAWTIGRLEALANAIADDFFIYHRADRPDWR